MDRDRQPSESCDCWELGVQPNNLLLVTTRTQLAEQQLSMAWQYDAMQSLGSIDEKDPKSNVFVLETKEYVRAEGGSGTESEVGGKRNAVH